MRYKVPWDRVHICKQNSFAFQTMQHDQFSYVMTLNCRAVMVRSLQNFTNAAYRISFSKGVMLVPMNQSTWLVFCWVGLIFFIETHAMLRSGFLMKAVAMTHQDLSCCRAVLHRAKAFSAPCAALPARRLGVHRELGGDTASTGGPGWPKGYLISLCHPIIVVSKKSWGKEGRSGGHSQCWHLSSQEIVLHDEPCFPGSGWTPACIWDVVNEFLALLCMGLLLSLVNLSLVVSTQKFSHFYLSNSLPHPTRGEGASGESIKILPVGKSF